MKTRDVTPADLEASVIAVQALRAHFLPLEDLCGAHSPIRVLHEAVRLAGIADTGALQPFLTNLAHARSAAA